MEINKTNMQLWVAALRSGDFEQCGTALTRISAEDALSHCCLGVACEVALVHGVKMEVQDFGCSGEERERSYNDWSSYLPQAVQEWLGVEDANPVVEGTFDDGQVCKYRLSTWNDTFHRTFPEIADMIENYFELKEPS